MSITNDDIKTEWELGDTIAVTMDGDGTDGDGDGGDTDGGRRRRRRRWRRLTADWLTRREPHPDAPGLDGLVEDRRARSSLTTCSVGRRGRRRGGGARPGASRRPPRCGPTCSRRGHARAGVPARPRRRDAAAVDVLPAGRRRAPHDRRRHPAQPRARAARRRRHDGPAGPPAQRSAPRPGGQQPGPRPRTTPCRSTPTSRRRGTTGLELHFDFHDVFVLQLDGRKRWRVWEPLPRTRHPVRRGPVVADADVRRAR